MDRRQFVAMLASLPLGAVHLLRGQTPASVHQWQALQEVLTDYVGAKKLAGAAIAVADRNSPLTYLKWGASLSMGTMFSMRTAYAASTR